MTRKNLTFCCTLSATTVVAAGLMASTALGGGDLQGANDREGTKVSKTHPTPRLKDAHAARITDRELRRITADPANQIRSISAETLRDLGLHNMQWPQKDVQDALQPGQTDPRQSGKKHGSSGSLRGAFIANPTGQQYSLSSWAGLLFGPQFFGTVDWSDPATGAGGSATDDIFTIGAPNPEAGRRYLDLTVTIPEMDYATCSESIIAYNGPAGTATFRSERRMSQWNGVAPVALLDQYFADLYPGAYLIYGGTDLLDSVFLMIGNENLLAWEPQSRVVSASIAWRSDDSDPWVTVGIDPDAFDAPFHGPDVLLIPGTIAGAFFLGGERLTLDIEAAAGPFTNPRCPTDIMPNDGSASYRGRIGDGVISIADINAVLTAFNVASGPPRPLGDIMPAGGDWVVSIADINTALASFNTVCPVYTNNDCGGPRSAEVVSAGTTSFTNVNATTDGPDHGMGSACDFFGESHILRDVWFSYTPSCAGAGNPSAVVIDTFGSNWDTKIAVYDAAGGCPTNDDDLLACNDDFAGNPLSYRSLVVVSDLAPGTTLLIRVGGSPAAPGGTGNTAPPPPLPGDPLDGFNGQTGYAGFLNIACFEQDNDFCADARNLVVGGPVVRFDNDLATNESPSPPASCGTDALANNNGGAQQAGGGSRWYRVTSPVDARLTISTDHNLDTNSNSIPPEAWYPVEIHVYCNGCDVLQCVASQANSNGPNGGTMLTFCAEGGREYLVAIWGDAPISDPDPDCCAKYDLRVTSAAPAGCVVVQCGADNDFCSDAIDVTGSINGPAVNGDSSLATPLAGVDDSELPGGSPTCHWSGEPDAVHHTVWYKFDYVQNTAFDNVTISACASSGSANDTVIMVFSGTCGALTEVGCGEDECGGPTWFSRVDLTAGQLTNNTTYYICIAASGGTGGVEVPGTFSFTITQVSVPPPSCPGSVYDQLPPDSGGAVNGSLGAFADVSGALSGGAREAADSFTALSNTSLSSLCWWGYRPNLALVDCNEPDNFTITIYNNDAPNFQPGTIAATYLIGNPTSVATGAFVITGAGPFAELRYTANLAPAFNMTNGVTYWISIRNDSTATSGQCEWLWRVSSGGNSWSKNRPNAGAWGAALFDMAVSLNANVGPGAAPPPGCWESFETATFPTVAAQTTGGGAFFTGVPGDWYARNRSNPFGTTAVFGLTGTLTPFPDGGRSAAMNFNATTGTNTISCWLLSPQLGMTNGKTWTFQTRNPSTTFPDRMEVRRSQSGASVDLGPSAGAAGALEVGAFTEVLLDINPGLIGAGGYPIVWTTYNLVQAGLTGTVNGRIGFRYFVTNGGPTGANSNLIGIDCVQWDGTVVP